MPINIGAYQELLCMHYQITTDNYEQNESPMTPEKNLFYTTIVYLYSNPTHSYF